VAYTLDPSQYTSWCASHGRQLIDLKRADIECYAWDLGRAGWHERGSRAGCARSPGSTATRSRRPCSTTSPAAHVRRRRLDYESHPTTLDRSRGTVGHRGAWHGRRARVRANLRRGRYELGIGTLMETGCALVSTCSRPASGGPADTRPV
jgi:hypothetical protein